MDEHHRSAQQLRECERKNHNLVRRRFVMARFLARVFDADPEGWILKGGVGMMVRLPEARYSKDIDLLVAPDISEPVETLRHVGREHQIDHFLFEVGPPNQLSNGKGVIVPVKAMLGGKVFDSFSIDLVAGRRDLVGVVERRPIPRLVDTDDFPQEASAQLYPLADQICAMYERHGAAGTESGRYRDLVDLLLISDFLAIDLRSAVAALECERELRGIPSLPAALDSPGSTWPINWPDTARKSPLTAERYDLDSALESAGRCYNRILSALPVTHDQVTWSHERGAWEP
ncbi:nucleotidyl transferase AbiEii/AbiGii toxin family protein [Nocardia sp. NPDC019395]|uniref:nucleotidyl transferase AbiEii/AbiGii toxin family protein n=1 Tax=Nocardia sp. NPDC019395 TaxID=3154686 RepID=UPI0033D45EF9